MILNKKDYCKMKNPYNKPELSVSQIEVSTLLAVSGVGGSNGIGFGGKDNSGMDADSPFRRGFGGFPASSF